MAFIFERIKDGDPVQSTQEYKRAVEFHYGLPCYARMVDIERDISLYWISVNSNDERPPGKYLVFYEHNPIVIHAYQGHKRIDIETVATVFRIVAIDIPSELGHEADDLRHLIVEAMTSSALNGEIPADQAIVEFQNC
jgi:hypothetical protein